MYALRCTGRLLARLRPDVTPVPVLTTTKLGDWYAAIATVGGRPLVLAVSDRTLLPVILPADDLARLDLHLPEGVDQVLRTLGAPADAIARERSAMKDVAMLPPSSQKVIGSLTEFRRILQFDPAEIVDAPLVELSVALAALPRQAIGMKSPKIATLELLRGRHLRRIV